jgi:hypothetical protein
MTTAPEGIEGQRETLAAQFPRIVTIAKGYLSLGQDVAIQTVFEALCESPHYSALGGEELYNAASDAVEAANRP